MLHYEVSRLRHEMPAVPTAKALGAPDRNAERAIRAPELDRLTAVDIVPWILAVLAVIAVIGGLRPFLPDGVCMDAALDRGATSWHGSDTSLWPPSATCTVEFDDGRSLRVEEASWAPVVGAGVAIAVWGLGLAHPPTWSWRRAAHVLSVPVILGSLALVFLAFEDGALHQAAFVGGALLTIGLVPAGVTALTACALVDRPPGRTFAAAWLLWALAIGGLIAL